MKNQQVQTVTALGVISCGFACLVVGEIAEALPNPSSSRFDSQTVSVYSGDLQKGAAPAHGNPAEKHEEEEKSKQGEGAETATKRTANGQTIFEMTKDGKKYEYYYINGQKGDFISQYDSSSGSFKWTTKDAMLGNVDRSTGLREVGSIQLQDGRLTKMYQTPGDSGQYVFNNGNSWVESPSMGNGSVYQERISPNFVGENGLPGTLPREGLFVKGPVDSPVSVAGSPGSMPVSDPFAVPVNDGSVFGLSSTQNPPRIPASTRPTRLVTRCGSGECRTYWQSY